MARDDITTNRVKGARDRLMKWDQVLGMTIDEMASKYRLTPGEVSQSLSNADKSGVLEKIEEGVFRDLMPKALAVIEQHLNEGSLKAAELTMALFGLVKTSVKAKQSFEINFPAETRGVGIVALDEIRQERQVLNAQKLERHDERPAVDHSSGETPPRVLPGDGRKH